MTESFLEVGGPEPAVKFAQKWAKAGYRSLRSREALILTDLYIGREQNGARAYDPETADFLAKRVDAGHAFEEEHVAHARWQEWLGDVQGSLETLQRAKARWPSSWRAFVVEAEILHRVGRTDGALASADHAVAAAPCRWETWRRKAWLHEQRGERQLAADAKGRSERVWALRHPAEKFE